MAVLLVVLAVLVYVVYLSPTGRNARENSDLGQNVNAPQAHYVSLEGNEVVMDEFQGEFLIVNLWASWSPFTQSDHSVLGEIKSAYGDRVTIRAVNRMESVETAKAYLDTIGRTEGIEYVLDTTDFLYLERGGYAMPETIIFDAVGNEVERIRGTMTRDGVEATLNAIIKASQE
jgi:thiol-disulfide isomerase/thioredoxin